jgi:hypothetical protein
MTWPDLLKAMRVEAKARSWAEFATTSWWYVVVLVASVVLLLGLVRFWRTPEATKAEGFAASLRARLDQHRLWVVTWGASMLACLALILTWNYTCDPTNLLRDLGVASAWQLSPAGVTVLLGRLRSLGWTQVILAVAGLAWLATVLFLKMSSQQGVILPFQEQQPDRATEGGGDRSKSQVTSQPQPDTHTSQPERTSPQTAGEQQPKAGPTSAEEPLEGVPLLRSTPTGEAASPAQQTGPDQGVTRKPAQACTPPARPAGPATEMAQGGTTAPRPSRRPDKVAPMRAPIYGESKPCFYLKLRYIDPNVSEQDYIHLDGERWYLGKCRPSYSATLYISTDGRNVVTQSGRRKWVRLRYEFHTKSLVGWAATDWDGQGEVRFGIRPDQVRTEDRRRVQDGEHFSVVATRFQFLLSLPEVSEGKTNDKA